MTSEYFRSRLQARTEEAGVQLIPGLIDKLEAYFQLLAIWNRRINLTALDLENLPNEAVDRLFIEPLAAARFAPLHRAVLDIGSGGGSPAIPFALATEARELTMVESRVRKSVFLREAARAVGLSDARVLTSRFAEVSDSTELASHFAIATVRAVKLEEADWSGLKRVVQPGGSFLLFHSSGNTPLNTPPGSVAHPLNIDSVVSIWTNPLS